MRCVASLLLKDVPGYRVRDSSFWTLAYRQLVHARPDNGPQNLYERLLPYLNARPLLSNVPAGQAKEACFCLCFRSICFVVWRPFVVPLLVLLFRSPSCFFSCKYVPVGPWSSTDDMLVGTLGRWQ